MAVCSSSLQVRLDAALVAAGIADQTYFVYSSDHGYHLVSTAA